MARRDEIISLIRAADAAGDSEDVRRLLAILDKAEPQAAKPPTPPAEGDGDRGGLLRALASGALNVPRQALTTGEAVIEATGYVPPSEVRESFAEKRGLDAWDPPDTPLPGTAGLYGWSVADDPLPSAEATEGLAKVIESAQQEVYKPTVAGDGVDAVNALAQGRVKEFASWLGETAAQSLPGLGVAMLNLPAAAAIRVGDIAKERVSRRGGGDVDASDLLMGLAGAVPSAYLDRYLGTRAIGKGSLLKTAAIGTGTEAISGAAEKAAAGGDLEEVGRAAFTEALAAGPMVAATAAAGAAARKLPSVPAEMTREASIRHAEELAGGRMPDGVSVAAQDVSPEAAQSLAQNVEVAEEVTAPVPKADPGVPTRPVVGERATPKEIPPDRHVSMAELIKLIADPASTDNEVHAKALEALAREANMEAGLEGPRIAAKHAEMDEVMLQAADELMMSEAAKKALTESQRISIAEVRLAARTQGLDSTMEEGDLGVANMSGKLDALVDSINERGYNPSAIEQAAVHSAVLLQKRAHQDILDAVKSKDTTHSMEELGARLEKTNKQILRLGQALRAAGSEMGRAFRYRQFMANKITTYSDAVATAMLKKKRLLTAGESKRLRKAWDKAVKLEADGLAERKKAHERLQKAQKLMKKAQKSGNEGSIQAAQKLIDQISDDLVKASAKVRLGERERASSISTVTMNRLLRGYKKAFGASLVLSSSGDDSALGRQAMGLFLKNPVKGLKTLPIVWQLAPWTQGHRAYALRTQKAILNADMQAIRDLAGLELTEIEGLSNVPGGGMLAREELFMFRALETGALGDQLVMPSQNAFGLTLNLLRAAHFDQAVKFLAQDYGANPNDIKDIMKKVPKADLQARAALINASTGRGKLVSGQGFGATVMRNIMFAPRFTLSRFESPYRTVQVVLGMGEFEGVSKATRKRIAAETGKRLGFFMGIGLMSTLLGDDDPEENALAFVSPKSGDFLKFRVGDYHIDLTGGLASTWRYVLPLLLGGDRPGAGMSQMVRNKAAPLIGALYDGVRGTDFRGRPVTLDAMKTDKAMEEFFNGKVNDYVAVILHKVVFPATGAFTPITLQNVADEAWSKMTGEEKEELQRILPIALDAFGVGARHYDPKETRRQRRGTIGPSRPSMPQ